MEDCIFLRDAETHDVLAREVPVRDPHGPPAYETYPVAGGRRMHQFWLCHPVHSCVRVWELGPGEWAVDVGFDAGNRFYRRFSDEPSAMAYARSLALDLGPEERAGFVTHLAISQEIRDASALTTDGVVLVVEESGCYRLARSERGIRAYVS